MRRETIHATTVAIDGVAVLLTGASGMGKSDLALRLIDRAATLVSDDYTILVNDPTGLLASAPAAIAGRIEVRGLGIVALPYAANLPVGLVVRLSHEVERMPGDGSTRVLLGHTVREVVLDPREASAPIKVEIAVRQARTAA